MTEPILLDVSEQALATTLEIISDGIWDWNAQTGYVYRSPGWYRMLGFDVDSLDNNVLTWEQVVHKGDYDRVMTHFEDYITGKSSVYKQEYRCYTNSDDYIWVEDRGRIVKRTSDGKVARMIGAHRDISAERLLLEQSRQKSLSLQKLIDLRTQELSALNLQLTKKIHEIERLATIDPVTSLANRYFFEQRIETEVARAKRFYEPLSLITIDVDHFKQINDQFGHVEGDNILTVLANVILQNIREVDIAARWGGDELMIILPNTVLTDAVDLAETLRVLVSKLDVKTGISLTCSFGVAQYSVGEPSKRFTIRADAALYEAKDSGRNMVSVAN